MERIGVAFTGGGLTPPEVVECVQLAEELGYEFAWMEDGHSGDQFSVLTACAVATTKILLGTSITSVFTRTPPTIAMSAVCLDYFSNGRLILGLGSSHKVEVEAEHGVPFTQAVPRMRECAQIVKTLLRDGRVSYQGDVFDIRQFVLWCDPVRREIPIYYAGVFPKMLRICGKEAQGAILVWSTLEHVKNAVENVAIGARMAGRKPSDVDMTVLLPCSVSDDIGRARDGIRWPIANYVSNFPRYRRLMGEAGYEKELEAVRESWLKGNESESLRLVPDELIDRVSLAGTPEACQQRISLYRETGIDLPIIVPRGAGPEAKQRVMEVIQACAPSKG